MGVISLDLNLFDQGKQTKFVHFPERLGPVKSLLHVHITGWSDEGVMEMGDGGDVPGVIGQGACKETAYVTYETDNRVYDLLGEPGDRRRAGRRGSVVRSARKTHIPDSGQSSIPNSVDE